MKTTKNELLPINLKYVTVYNNVDWTKNGDKLKRYYISTEATTTQLKKLGIQYYKALYGFDNTYKKYYKAITGNIIRKKDEPIVDAYLFQLEEKNEAKQALRAKLISAITPLNIIPNFSINRYTNTELKDLIKQHIDRQVALLRANGNADHLLKMVLKDALRINEAEGKYEVCALLQDGLQDLQIKELLNLTLA